VLGWWQCQSSSWLGGSGVARKKEKTCQNEKKISQLEKDKKEQSKKKHTRGPNNDNIVWAHFLAVPVVGGREEVMVALMVVVMVEVMCWHC
jgi:hypothetical protein